MQTFFQTFGQKPTEFTQKAEALEPGNTRIKVSYFSVLIGSLQSQFL
jgi:hypothetical protein